LSWFVLVFFSCPTSFDTLPGCARGLVTSIQYLSQAEHRPALSTYISQSYEANGAWALGSSSSSPMEEGAEWG